ncbi:MAG: hypothetical protein HYT76_03295 [Deltaproteobacteria bacterium]|nr:hypothetical protein [Deltaproteobacteria bacterium]
MNARNIITAGVVVSAAIVVAAVLAREWRKSTAMLYPPELPPSPPEPPVQLIGDTPYYCFMSAYLDGDRLTQREFTALVSKYPKSFALFEDLRAAYKDDFVSPDEAEKLKGKMEIADEEKFTPHQMTFPWVTRWAPNMFVDQELWDLAVPILQQARGFGYLDALPNSARDTFERELFRRVNLAAATQSVIHRDDGLVKNLMSHVEGLSLFFSKDPGDVEFLSQLLPFKYYRASENNGQPWAALPQLGCELQEAFDRLGTSYQYATEMKNQVTENAVLYCDRPE